MQNSELVTISDTHGKHKELVVSYSDVVIHAGDITMEETEVEAVDFFIQMMLYPGRLQNNYILKALSN